MATDDRGARMVTSNMLTAVSLIGLFHVVRRAKAVELTFWALLWASIVASSCVIYFDDGPRALAASHPLMALFFAIGMSSRALAPAKLRAGSPSVLHGSLAIITAALLFVGMPWMAYRIAPAGFWINAAPLQEEKEAYVFGGRRMSGFLIVADDMPLRSDVPSIHLGDFDAIVKKRRGVLSRSNPPNIAVVAIWLRFCSAHGEGHH